MFDGTISAIIMRKKTNCIESVSCRMKQIHVWRYYLSNYHENRNKLHRSCKLWDEVGRWVWRYYPSNDQGGLRKVAMNQLVVVWSSYMCLKVLSQQWSGGHKQIAKNQFVVGWGSYTFLKVLSQQKLGTGWNQLQWIRNLQDTVVMYVWRYHLYNNLEGLQQMAAKKAQ